MSEKILNTVRGSAANVTERASLLTQRQCRERRQANGVSCVIKTDLIIPKDYDRRKNKKRTILWP